MKVSVILSNKSSSEIATILPSATVGDALHDLRARRIGALVVSQGNGEIGGILSERDIVRAMAEHGAGTLDRQVSEFMTSTVETCFDSETALVVLGRMTDGRFRHMPVTDQAGRMIGILSIGDVVKARLEEIERENAAMTELLSG